MGGTVLITGASSGIGAAAAARNWLVAGLASAYAVYLKYWEATTFIQTPLPLIAVISFNTGVLSLLMGFLAELLMRTYFESQHKTPYAVKRAINLEGHG